MHWVGLELSYACACHSWIVAGYLTGGREFVVVLLVVLLVGRLIFRRWVAHQLTWLALQVRLAVAREDGLAVNELVMRPVVHTLVITRLVKVKGSRKHTVILNVHMCSAPIRCILLELDYIDH